MSTFFKKTHDWLLAVKYSHPVVTRLRFRLPVTVTTGTVKETGAPFTFAYVGTLGTQREYWKSRFFSETLSEESLGYSWVSQAEKTAREHNPDCAFIIYELNPFSQWCINKKLSLRVPRFAQMLINLTPPLEEILRSNGFKDVERRIRKHKLTYESTDDQQMMKDFYENMHLPYIKKRHGRLVRIIPYRYFKKKFLSSLLYLLKMNGEAISGMILFFHKKEPKLYILGIKDGDYKYVPMGAIGALYYGTTVDMKKQGFKRLYLGGTNVDLTDGVTRYKLNLGAAFTALAKDKACFHIQLLKDTPGARDCLSRHPFVFYITDAYPCRAFFTFDGRFENIDGFTKAYRSSNAKGLNETRVYVFGDTSQTSQWVQELKLEQARVLSASSLMGDNSH